jgi:DICT domain-containing protein/signal transduction histidine kinase
MRTLNSLLDSLLEAFPDLRTQVYFKGSLKALSHAIEDLVLVGTDRPLVIANFQQERFYRQETRRYQRIAQRTEQVYVLATPDTDFGQVDAPYMTIALDPTDRLAQEWHVVVIGQKYSACLVCHEHSSSLDAELLDQSRQFKGFWTFDRAVSLKAADLMLQTIQSYRPELSASIQQAKKRYSLAKNNPKKSKNQIVALDARLFTDRLVTYLQSSQYKLLRTYRKIALQEQKERLINSITNTIRQSLNFEAILAVTATQIGQIFSQSRCLIYQYTPGSQRQPLAYEYVGSPLDSMKGKLWSLADYPLFQAALANNQTIAIADVNQDTSLKAQPTLKTELHQHQIQACLIVPIRYQEIWLGILELHEAEPHLWQEEEVSLIEEISAQVGVALIQAQAYSNLETLNQQLSDLERTQNNLVAIVGHELRTPLSTIQVCLESLASEPEMPIALQQTMLEMALSDSERLRKLIQDFLTLSRLESGLTHWQLEAISLQESLDLVISNFTAYQSASAAPQITVNLPTSLPLVYVDGEGLTEVLTKLIDNAYKFTKADDKIIISAQAKPLEESSDRESGNLTNQQMEIVISDTGKGIAANQLEEIFECFYQGEGFLQRSVGGTGLGLAIARRIIQRMGGMIWATSAGIGQGSEFHFTIPLA